MCVGGRRLCALPVIQLLFLNVDDLDYISASVCVVQYYAHSVHLYFPWKTTFQADYLQLIDCDQAFWSTGALKQHSKLKCELVLNPPSA